MRRTPPPTVRRLLRREVNFGCPVATCGSPYLEYHHFDPPFSQKEHHDPDGMIALCCEHHGMADQGQWTVSDLRKMKAYPFVTGENLADQYLGWQRNELILAAGGFYVNPSVFLRLNGRKVVWCERDNVNKLKLNIDIRGEDDRSIILMDANDWLEISRVVEIKDIEIPPHGHKLTVDAPALGISFKIEFREYSDNELRRLGQQWGMELDQLCGPTEPFPDFFVEIAERYASHANPSESEIDPSVLRQLLRQTSSTRSQQLLWAVRQWPVTVCVMDLSLKYPFQVEIRHGKENVGGWKAGHTIAYNSNVVWDIRH